MATIYGSSEDIGDPYAPSLNAALRALEAASGIRPRVRTPYGGRRTTAEQRYISPAVRNPASSDHVKGRGVDIDNQAQLRRILGSPRFEAILAEHGWHNIDIGGRPFPSEPWHFANHDAIPQGTGTRPLPGRTAPAPRVREPMFIPYTRADNLAIAFGWSDPLDPVLNRAWIEIKPDALVEKALYSPIAIDNKTWDHRSNAKNRLATRAAIDAELVKAGRAPLYSTAPAGSTDAGPVLAALAALDAKVDGVPEETRKRISDAIAS